MSDILRDFDKKNEFPKVKIPKFATGGICNDAIFPKLDVFSQIDEIVKDIREQQDNAMAMEFTKCIGELLRKNGVVPKVKQFGCDFYGENSFQSKSGVIIDKLDFSEHDKVFEDKIAELEKRIQELDTIDTIRHDEKRELKQRIAELESRETVDLPFDPLECANYLINATYERETSSLERAFAKTPEKVNSDRYTVDDLEQIAEHLLVYCKHNKECQE